MNSNLYDPAFWSRLQFGFTLTYHYLFPQLTMGLAWFLVYWKWRALRTGDGYSQMRTTHSQSASQTSNSTGDSLSFL
jgi:cytochrome bd-type quinol oxidase subunit 1